MSDLQRAVDTVIAGCLGVGPREDVLVVVDPETRALGDALRDRAAAAGADAVVALMAEREANGSEPPAPARGATMPGVTTDMLARVMAVDFEALRARSAAVARALGEADEARLTCPRGSDFRLDLRGREAISDDGDLTAPGAFGNLPCGEGFIAPAGGDGTIVASSLAAIGLADEPARLTVRDCRLAAAEGRQGERLLETLRGHGEILGTAHVAFGASAGIGGTVAVPIHLDVVVLDATLTAGGVSILEAGRLVLAT